MPLLRTPRRERVRNTTRLLRARRGQSMEGIATSRVELCCRHPRRRSTDAGSLPLGIQSVREPLK